MPNDEQAAFEEAPENLREAAQIARATFSYMGATGMRQDPDLAPSRHVAPATETLRLRRQKLLGG